MNHPSVALTPAECLTLYLIAQGQSQPTVALLRGVRFDTVRNQLQAARSTRAARSTTHAVSLACKAGLFHDLEAHGMAHR